MFKGAAGKRSPSALGVRLKSSMNAQCVPIIGGRVQASPYLIWKANQQTHSTSSKKGKAAKKGGDMLTYSADLDMLLGTAGFGRTSRADYTQQGIQSVLAIYSDKDKYDVIFASWSGVVSGGAVTITVPGGGTLVQIIGVTVAESYSVTFNDYGGFGSDPESGTGTAISGIRTSTTTTTLRSSPTPVAAALRTLMLRLLGSSSAPRCRSTPG
jgi:hypothetical protein